MAPYSPFSGVETEDGRLHGRGSCDTKATLACAISLLHELKAKAGSAPLQTLLPVNLIVCGTVGEETSCLGANGAWCSSYASHLRLFVSIPRVASEEKDLCGGNDGG